MNFDKVEHYTQRAVFWVLSSVALSFSMGLFWMVFNILFKIWSAI